MKILNEDRFLQLPDGVLLDTDNTLYAYEPAHMAGMNAVKRKVEIELSIDGATFDKAFATARREIKELLGDTASSHSRLLYMQRLIENLDLGSQILLSLDLEQTYWRTFLLNAKLFDGVEDFLVQLRFFGVPLAIVTDLTAQIQFRKLIYFRLDQYFDVIVTSEEAGRDKPDPRPFNLVRQKLQTSGNRLWMVGDDPETDIRGARLSLGAITLQKIHPGVEVGTGDCAPDACFADFNDLASFVGKLAGKRG